MKILKSHKEIEDKRTGGMDPDEEVASYQEYENLSKNPAGTKGDDLEIEYKNGKKETYYCWVFYQEDPDGLEVLPDYVKRKLDKEKKKKLDKFRFKGQAQQERYEWFCGGWVQFYDDILRPEKELGGMEHKLFFYWNRIDKHGVAIYINDKRATTDYEIQLKYEGKQLIYTAPTATSDPPIVPPPPPPSKT